MKTLISVFILTCFSLTAAAQVGGFGELIGSSKPKQHQKNPTIITSKTLVVDGMANNAEFKGNVIVDDDDLTIHCDTLIIFIEEIPDTAVQSDKPAAEPKDDPLGDLSKGNNGTKRQVNRIECIGHVLMIRKRVEENNQPADDQRAISDKAVYYVPQEKIVLSGKERPVIHHGKDIFSGTELIFYRNTSKIEGTDVRIEMAPRSGNTGNPLKKDKKPAAPKPRTQF